MVVTPRAVRRYAPGSARARGAAAARAGGPVIPYDYAASFRLTGAPGNIAQGVINIGVDGKFVATAIGYGLEEERGSKLELPGEIASPDSEEPAATFKLGDVRLGHLAPDALINGFRVKPRPFIADDVAGVDPFSLERIFAQPSRHGILERVRPGGEISFFLSIVDSNSGRELQDEPVHNLASLGKSNGERPFRLLPQPLSFAPRSTVRLQVVENTEGAAGTLFIVLYGYKILAASHCPEPVVRGLRGTPGCPAETIGLPSDRIMPFDYVANLQLLGIPGRMLQQDVNVNVDGGFVASALGYALAVEEQDVRLKAQIERVGRSAAASDVALRKRLFPDAESQLLDLNAVPFSLFAPHALHDGVRIRPSLLRVALEDGGRLTQRLAFDLVDKIFEPLNRAEDVSFRYTIFDTGTGRELQNGLINNVAGLGIANGDRPFKKFARPMIFFPRSAIRVVVREHFGRGRLYMVFQGYKLGPSLARGRRR